MGVRLSKHPLKTEEEYDAAAAHIRKTALGEGVVI
jgi:hypothetical protein